MRKANNLSDLASLSISRTNLGVAIGADVQAHSAVLDATTASFTIADETKLDNAYSVGGTDVALADGGTGASTASAARTNLGLAIGTDVQAYDAQLADLAGLTPTDSTFIVGNGTNRRPDWVCRNSHFWRGGWGIRVSHYWRGGWNWRNSH
jgi:hypothetical protein